MISDSGTGAHAACYEAIALYIFQGRQYCAFVD